MISLANELYSRDNPYLMVFVTYIPILCLNLQIKKPGGLRNANN